MTGMPINLFYNDFDTEELEPRQPDYRSVFQLSLIHISEPTRPY